MSENNTPPMKQKVEEKKVPKAPKKKKNKKKSYTQLMKSLMKSNLTEEQRVQKQKNRINNILVDANFKQIDII